MPDTRGNARGIPVLPGLSTAAFLREGYGFIGNRCRALESNAFRTRLMLRQVTCLCGPKRCVFSIILIG